VLPVVVGVDVVLGPLLTFIIASPKKPGRVLARDIACIVVVQLVALSYGSFTLWKGRPVYYTFDGRVLSPTQGIDLQPDEIALAQKTNPELAPHWYSLPRWAWAPKPDDKTFNAIRTSAVIGGYDVTAMPRFFKPWKDGFPELRKKLQKVDDLAFFSAKGHKALKERLKEQGFDPDAADGLAMTGQGTPLLAVFDLKTLEIKAIVRAD